VRRFAVRSRKYLTKAGCSAGVEMEGASLIENSPYWRPSRMFRHAPSHSRRNQDLCACSIAFIGQNITDADIFGDANCERPRFPAHRICTRPVRCNAMRI
jgi:hypothetical protein